MTERTRLIISYLLYGLFFFCSVFANQNTRNALSEVENLITKDIRILSSQSARAFNAIHCFSIYLRFLSERHAKHRLNSRPLFHSAIS